MLRRLRWRFIGVAALSLTAVLLLLTLGINLFFRIQNDKNEDAMLRLIAEQKGSIPPIPALPLSGAPKGPPSRRRRPSTPGISPPGWTAAGGSSGPKWSTSGPWTRTR